MEPLTLRARTCIRGHVTACCRTLHLSAPRIRMSVHRLVFLTERFHQTGHACAGVRGRLVRSRRNGSLLMLMTGVTLPFLPTRMLERQRPGTTFLILPYKHGSIHWSHVHLLFQVVCVPALRFAMQNSGRTVQGWHSAVRARAFSGIEQRNRQLEYDLGRLICNWL